MSNIVCASRQSEWRSLRQSRGLGGRREQRTIQERWKHIVCHRTCKFLLVQSRLLHKPSWKDPPRNPPPSPDSDHATRIDSLLDSATIRPSQTALKRLVLRRDGPSCPITRMPFDGDGSVIPHCAHIIPFSFHDRPPVLTAIEMFTGNEVTADIIRRINNPANAMNLESNAHDSMDKKLAWSIEAISVDNEWRYYFRVVRLAGILSFLRPFIQDGNEIKFGEGDNVDGIALPDPRLCNLHLAVTRVFTASVFVEVIDKVYRDTEGDAPTWISQ